MKEHEPAAKNKPGTKLAQESKSKTQNLADTAALWLTVIALGSGALTWMGGLGATVCSHRALTPRALRLHPIVREVLIST